ncbi:pentapeptide repeat-containing protein [Azotobacter vinelandii]|uniref:pentapeptide repeat-containing protein n=1 Tax=Azotobacter vinelandii TaxID=354 RepID=UPI0026657E87|nr:pentapeptide repeat-containing protein [Azotobacter vinelandii]WKN20849.1 pentapeptide repeat-containing protein [Azotobacter vinelandii]
MKTYTAAELAEIIEKHRKWLGDEEGGEKAYLGEANLSGANLSGAYLGGANLSGANLRGAYLGEANLGGANLSGANLSGANLRGAYLGEANLGGANLSGANLSGANLRGAYLGEANLGGAYLGGAYLGGANLSGANLRGANLSELTSLFGTTGNMKEIKSLQCDLWPVAYTATHMQIGCQLHRLDEWWSFSDDEIDRMSSYALEWWRIWKPILQKIVETSPAAPGAQAEKADTQAA